MIPLDDPFHMCEGVLAHLLLITLYDMRCGDEGL